MMRVGKDTGSLINSIMSSSKTEVPKVGDGATILSWTDRSPGTVYDVYCQRGKWYVTVREDLYKMKPGHDIFGDQQYDYFPNGSGSLHTFRIDLNAALPKWQRVRKNPETGRWNQCGDQGVMFGHRDRYYDPCF